jgi:hypothetical protein
MLRLVWVLGGGEAFFSLSPTYLGEGGMTSNRQLTPR